MLSHLQVNINGCHLHFLKQNHVWYQRHSSVPGLLLISDLTVCADDKPHQVRCLVCSCEFFLSAVMPRDTST